MALTKRQASFLLLVCLLANKLQKLPNFIATNVHRNGYLVFLILGAIDILLMFLVLFTNKRSKQRDVYQICERAGGKVFAKIIMLLLSVFFFVSALIPYESIHDLFAYVLFDHLSWELYSLILLVAIFFLASRGLKNIGRVTEIFFYIAVLKSNRYKLGCCCRRKAHFYTVCVKIFKKFTDARLKLYLVFIKIKHYAVGFVKHLFAAFADIIVFVNKLHRLA